MKHVTCALFISALVAKGEQGDDSKAEGLPGPQGDRVSFCHAPYLCAICWG